MAIAIVGDIFPLKNWFKTMYGENVKNVRIICVEYLCFGSKTIVYKSSIFFV